MQQRERARPAGPLLDSKQALTLKQPQRVADTPIATPLRIRKIEQLRERVRGKFDTVAIIAAAGSFGA
jgi:hypothetical protein